MSAFPYSTELPWGSWLRTVTSPFGAVTVVDERGRHWSSIRDCFWGGRLRMSMSSPRVRDEHLELMLAGLASLHRGIVHVGESAHAIFAGSHAYQRHWRYWMHMEGLIDCGDRSSPQDGTISAEGIAVLRMLAATRPFELNAVPIGQAAVTLFGEPDTDGECDRDRFEAAEASARMLRFALVRETVFGRPAISMLHRNPTDTVPLARTIWHLPWPEWKLRDGAYRWMYDRSDLWTRWGEMVLADGAAAFTQHLLVLLVAGGHQPRPDGPAAPSLSTSIAYRPPADRS